MPKIHDTRKQRAHALIERLQRGPSFSAPFDGSAFTIEEATRIYRGWFESWVSEDVRDLIPELRKEQR